MDNSNERRHVMLNLVQHLVWFFLPLADAPFIPVPAYRQAGTGRGFQVRS